MVTKAAVLERLKQVIDPELGVNVVDLGLVYEIKVQKGKTLRLSGASHSTRSAQGDHVERGRQAALKSLASSSSKKAGSYRVKIVMTLTTPGCPLAPIIEALVRRALDGWKGIEAKRDVKLEITFDPPWVPDMMTEEVRAELGLD